MATDSEDEDAGQDGRDSDASTGGDSDPDPDGREALRGLAEQVRSTAKWLIAAFAAVGALLVPGLQIANLGALSGGRLAWALASAGVGSAAVIVTVSIVARVLSVAEPSFAELVKRERENAREDPLMKVLRANKTLLQAEAGSIEELRDRYRDALADREAAYSASNVNHIAILPTGSAAANPSEQAKRTRDQLDAAAARVALLRPILDQLAGIAEFQDIRRKFQRTQLGVASLTVVTAAALVSFALAGRSPDHATSDFSDAHLTSLDLRGTNLEEADFSGARLTHVDLRGSDLQDVSFSGAHLTKVNLAGANTHGVNTDGAVLTMSTCVNGTLDGQPSSSGNAPTSTKSCISAQPLVPSRRK